MGATVDTHLLLLEGRRSGLPTSGIPGIAGVDLADGLVTLLGLTARDANISVCARGAGHGYKKCTGAKLLHQHVRSTMSTVPTGTQRNVERHTKDAHRGRRSASRTPTLQEIRVNRGTTVDP